MASANLRLVAALNRVYAVVTVQGKVAIMHEYTHPMTDNHEIELMSRVDFRTRMANQFLYDPDGNTRQHALADYWLRSEMRRTYDGIIFDPSRDPAEPDDWIHNPYYNLWRGFAVESREGDCSLYLDHVRGNICGGDEALYAWVLAWMADAVQRPARRPGTAIVLRGRQGTGKGVFAREFGALFGQHFKHVHSARHLTGHFNAHMANALVVFADEAFWAGDKSAEGTLKALVTEPTLAVEYKGKDAFFVQNNVRLIVASNHDWVVPAGPGERRFLVLDVGEEHMQDRDYFRALVGQMENGGREALLHRLQHHDIGDLDVGCIPRTDALRDQKVCTMSPPMQWWLDRLMEGAVISLHDDWHRQVEKRLVADAYVEHARRSGATRRASETELGMVLRKFVPGLRTTRCVMDMRNRVRVFAFPSLAECRAAFDRLVGQEFDWPQEDEDDIFPQNTLP